MRHLLLIPALLSLYSLLLYAFTGNAIWAPLGPDDGIRFVLLGLFYGAGVFCAARWFIAGADDE